MKTCPDCGCRVYSLGCVNCDEARYIEAEFAEELAEIRERDEENPRPVPAADQRTVTAVAKAARAKAEILRTDPAWRKRFKRPNEQAFALDHFASDLEASLWTDWLRDK